MRPGCVDTVKGRGYCSSLLHGWWCEPRLSSSLSRIHWAGAILPLLYSVWPMMPICSGWRRVNRMLEYVSNLPSSCYKNIMVVILDRRLMSCACMPLVEACFGYVDLSVFVKSFKSGTTCTRVDCIKYVLSPEFIFFDKCR
jgi:hypothetical protein